MGSTVPYICLLVPCIGIGINMYMLAGLSPDSWIRVGGVACDWLVYYMDPTEFGIAKSDRPYNSLTIHKNVYKET